MIKKIFKISIKIIFTLILFAFLAGFFGVVAERFVMPWLSSIDSLQKFRFFQKANERVTVINKTEQITVKEDFSVTKAAQSILPAVVSIIDLAEQADASSGGTLAIKTSIELKDKIRTGFIITSDGLIISVAKEPEITNNLLPIGKKVKILVADGREFDASVVAVDAFSNLVFYKSPTSNLPSPSFGNSDELENGEKIIIIGNAGGEYQNAFSLGLVKEKDKTFSLLNSELSASEKMEGAILTDALIDNQNIGGPVVDFNGQIAGIAGLIKKDGNDVGYIIPINFIKPVIDRVVRGEKITRPYFGAYYLSINKEIALLNNLPVKNGALVYSFSSQQGLAVIKNSPADKAGILIGDIITGVNNDQVTLDSPLSNLLMKYKSGEEINLKMLRRNKEMQLKVTLD